MPGQQSAEELLERVAALKHDLGKYVAWTSANLDGAAWEGPMSGALLSALQDDLLRTRRRGEEVEAAWQVWARLTEDLPRPLAQSELQEVESAVQRLRSLGPALEAGDLDAVAARRAEVREAQLEIRRQLSALFRRLRSEVYG